MLNWSAIETPTQRTLSVIFSDGETAVISSSHPHYLTLLNLMREGSQDEKVVKRLLDPAGYYLSGRLTYDNGQYRLDGKVVNARRLKAMFAIEGILEDTGD